MGATQINVAQRRQHPGERSERAAHMRGMGERTGRHGPWSTVQASGSKVQGPRSMASDQGGMDGSSAGRKRVGGCTAELIRIDVIDIQLDHLVRPHAFEAVAVGTTGTAAIRLPAIARAAAAES